jgi:EAL domain-containing protein (putative c-di-GMP-specific phosphodiesterase class I)
MAEYAWLRDCGIDLFQGYLFARPGFQTLPTVDFAELRAFDIERHAKLVA